MTFFNQRAKEKTMAEPSIQNTADLRDFLLRQMHRVVSKEISDAEVDHLCRLCDQVTRTLALEIRAAESGHLLGPNRNPDRLALV